MKRIVALLLVMATVTHAAGERRRAVGKPAPSSSIIDTYIDAKLRTAGVTSAAVAGDAEFLRRVTVDLTGAIPTATEAETFFADTRNDKRARKIDELLQSSAFVDRWTLWYGDLVQNVQASDAVREYYLGRNAHYLWIKESIRSGKPYDAMVREDLAGEGESFTSGVANYVVRQIQRNGPPQDTFDNLAAHSAEKFLGIPMLCISCHSGTGHLELVNIYLRGKTREDFWKMAAFFSRTTTRGTRYTDPQNPNANIIQFSIAANPLGTYRLNTTDGNKSPRAPAAGKPDSVTPAFLTTGEQPKPGEPYRVAYGRMLTADRQFARATVNYLWKEMFGTAIVEPVNAFDLARLSSQASHPELLEALTDDFISGGYNLRALLRSLAMSSAYQRSSTYTGTHPDAALFARRAPRRLTAEVLFDAIVTATGVPPQFQVQGLGNVTKAVQLADPLEGRRNAAGRFLDTFGRGNRDDVSRTNDSAIAQALALMNDTVVTTRVRRANNSTVTKLLASTNDPATIADQLYLATLSRKPSAAERQIAIDYLRAGVLAERTEDLQFVLLNSLEFLFV